MEIIEHYDLKLRRSGKPVSRNDIANAERALGVEFPAPYVDFLLANNGGSPSPAYLPYPGASWKIDRFFPIDDTGLVSICQKHRAENGLVNSMVPIAEFGDVEDDDDEATVLLLECAGPDVGALSSWCNPKQFGFRYNDPEYSNVGRLYFDISELPRKFGPAKNRKDPDGMFCQLYYASSLPAHGSRLAKKFVDEGYDINFVLPTFEHPIFGAINYDAFGVAATFLALGTSISHVDPRHENATVYEQLLDAQNRWQRTLEFGNKSGFDTVKGMAKRRLADIAKAMAIISKETTG